MNEILLKGLKAFAVGVIGAMVFDLDKYVSAINEADDNQPLPTFDWKLAVIRWLKGGATAVAGVFGIDAI